MHLVNESSVTFLSDMAHKKIGLIYWLSWVIDKPEYSQKPLETNQKETPLKLPTTQQKKNVGRKMYNISNQNPTTEGQK